MNDLACVSPNGESFGRLTKIKLYATKLMTALTDSTVERLSPVNFALELVDFLPKKLHSKPPAVWRTRIII